MATKERKESKKDSLRLLFVGSPLLDITAHGSQDDLEKYSLRPDDCILATAQHESLFQTLFKSPDSKIVPGGSSQNTARISKWVLKEKGKISFAGCVGKDDFAEKMSSCLRLEGVVPEYIPLPDKSTGICACLINSVGDRSMCARLGAAEYFSREHLLKGGIRKRLAEADCIFVEGYFFAHSPDAVSALAEMCSEKQIFSLSLSAEYICRDYAQLILKTLPRVDILLSNEAEAKTLAETLKMGHDLTVEDIAVTLATKDRLPSMKPRTVIVTRGPNPVLLVQGKEAPQTFPVPAGIKVVDSVGCGDAIAGGFLAVYALTDDVATAAKIGILAASEIAQVPGCSPTTKNLYPLEENNGFSHSKDTEFR